MREPSVSVALATYDGERFLQELLDSLARQTLLPCELVACDDGSTDGTLDILHSFAADAPFPVRIHQNGTRLGHSRNFLRAASLCSGTLIAFADQDDVWLDHKLRRCAEVISETDSVLVIHAAEVVDERLLPIGARTWTIRHPVRLDAGEGRGWQHLGTRLATSPGFACVFQSRLVKQVPEWAPDKGQERWLFFAAEVMGSVTLIPDVLVLYRQHGRNTIGFRTRRLRGRWPIFEVGGAEYRAQVDDAATRARVLADVVACSPEQRTRLDRAARWFDARAESLACRADLYATGLSSREQARCLLSLLLGGTYRTVSQGGLGLKALAKDLVVPFLSRALKCQRPDSEPGATANGRPMD